MQHNPRPMDVVSEFFLRLKARRVPNAARATLLACLVAMVWCLPAAAQTGTPTVNGLFYGDGDHLRYPQQPFALSDNGSRLHLTLINNVLYVALVVDRSFNDNVCAKSNGGGQQINRNKTYLSTAGWLSGGNLSCLRRMDSEFAEFIFTVGQGGNAQTFTWQQGYAGQPDGNHNRATANYISDETVAGGSGTPPLGLVSASSMMWNLNRYAEQLADGDPNTPTWSMPGNNTDPESWISPWLNADDPANDDPTTVIDASEGYPSTGQITFSQTYQWEWPMVYEWSVDMSQFGQSPVFVVTGSSHHSPSKKGPEDDPFSVVDPQPLSDYGDLPDLYGTLRASNGAQHVIDTGSTLRMGAGIDSESNGQPDQQATGDDSSGVNDEDGVAFPEAAVVDESGVMRFETTVTATNTGSSAAMLCAWFDFDQNNAFNNGANTSTGASDPGSASATDAGERSCITVPAGTNGGTFPISWTIPESAQGSAGLFAFRYRLSRDSGMFASATLSPVGSYNSGEVEDYVLDLSSSALPVSLSSFESRYTTQGLEVSWTTVSETHNIGFHVWGDKGNGLEPLTTEPVPAAQGGPVSPRGYTLLVPDVAKGDVWNLAVTAVDYLGDEEVYGLFEPDERYGQAAGPAPIAWNELRRQVSQRAEFRAAAEQRAASTTAGGDGAGRRSKQPQTTSDSAGGATAAVVAADVRPAASGLVEVRYEQLLAAGLDLAGVPEDRIAVSLKGEPVSRHIAGIAGQGFRRVFGPGASIRFWSETPSLPDALYLDAYSYRIEDDPALARPAESLIGAWGGFSDSFELVEPAVPQPSSSGSYLAWVRSDENVAYNFANPLPDPWYAAQLRADRNNAHTTTFELDGELQPDLPGRLRVQLGGLTDFPVSPDHHAVVEVNGVELGSAMFDGAAIHDFDLEIPAGTLRHGSNAVTVRAPGGTAAPVDLFLLNTVELGHSRRMKADANRLHIEKFSGESELEAEGFTYGPFFAYAHDGDELHVLAASESPGGRLSVSPLAQTADYWLAGGSGMVAPDAIVAVAGDDPLAGARADFLIIAHPAFLPLSDSEAHPLNDFVAVREAEGWSVALFDVHAIQQHYGWGMPLPQAVNRFLAQADQKMNFEHVLLVGSDSYDYTDNLGLGSVSFIPTHYASTLRITHTPADALLADLDGDGLSDKALGRWPVRSIDDLHSIVTKTLDWNDMRGRKESVWVTDSEDSRHSSFRDQAERMMEPLLIAQWPEAALDRVYFDEVVPLPGLSVAATAREELFSKLSEGRSLTGFVGHGAPSMWTFQGLLTPDDLSDLHNVGRPTMITTMTCYTSYFVSPHNDTVAHRWMNGYREDAFGDQIPGVANGAVAIHGAATLSSYYQNERVSREVLHQQLRGATLGQAIQTARRQARMLGMPDQVINWTLLGDPTLKLGADN